MACLGIRSDGVRSINSVYRLDNHLDHTLTSALPDPNHYMQFTFRRADHVLQRGQDEAGRWYWVEIHPLPMREAPRTYHDE